MPFIFLFIALLFPGAAKAQQIAWLWDEAQAPAWSLREVAVLQRHILLSGDQIQMRPRMRWPALPPGALVTPVLHVEVSIVNPPVQIERARPLILHAMMDAAAVSSTGWVQLDMEARPSQRAFYRALVKELRAALPSHIKLSVTALAWWCRSPAWLDDLAADEVVPMFFRMGRDSTAMHALLDLSPDTLHPSCRAGAAGFSPQEPFARNVVTRYTKTYWFDRHAWKRGDADLPPLSRNSP
ncbi:hypothetical protein GJ699_18475 [Duganella sp. FT80W]|uniref:DUF3142 domain-containing protein n=1 Tax=Duganella guangzhouensis TaxID=2666084 RepID=A0A6I2L2E6_9BURK|nr:hypothetical protein [Duganella guangzhouensis]MRW91982.1 hypothetical protein [Duganella guangzhouensis]